MKNTLTMSQPSFFSTRWSDSGIHLPPHTFRSSRDRKKGFLFILLAFTFLAAGAQQKREITVTGDVKDGFLKMPLVDARIAICSIDSTVLVDTCKTTAVYRSGRLHAAFFSTKLTTDASELLVHARLEGYGDVWKRVHIGQKAEVDVPTLEMRKMMDRKLSGAEVRATRVKMFYRGDTLVYDATAFNLPQGSMLDNLIRQMPGVTLNEAGEIYVNGRKVDELLLGARLFMKGNKQVLMKNLPYYTVKHIKVYEKQSDKSVALGYDVDPKKFVMDVNLKQEYQRGYIANVEGAAGTEHRWLGRAFLLGFTNHYRFTLLGNLNNVNETRHVSESDYWTPATMPRNMLTTRSVAGEMDYHSKGDVIKNNLTASYTSTTDIGESRSRYEQFMEGLTPTSRTESFNRTGNRRWKASDVFTLIKPFYLRVESEFNYSKTHGGFHSLFEQWSDSLTALQRNRGFSEGKSWNANIDAQGAFNIGISQKSISFQTKAEIKEDESESAQRYNTLQYANRQSNLQHNVDDFSNRTTWGIASANYNAKLFKNVEWNLGESLYMIHTRTHDYLYHPDTLMLASQLDALNAVTDFNNSYRSKNNIVENTLSLSFSRKGYYKLNPTFPITISYQRWSVGFSVPIRHESLDYQRGAIDTLAKQNTLFFNTSASFRHVWAGGKYDLRIHADHKRSSATLSDRIDYRDDSRPLVIKKGNPDLKSFITSVVGIDLNNKGGQNKQQWHVGASADFYHRQTAQSVSYQAETGVYTYQPVNVRGAYRLDVKFDMSRPIDKNGYWTWQNNADATLNHNVDYAMLAGMTESKENVVNTLMLQDGAYIQYNKGMLNIRATGDICWRHSEGKMYDFATLNATDFKYGLNARYTLPRLNTTLSVDGNMYSRRGYGSSNLNADDFVLNAAVSQPLCKGKLIAGLEAFDLLHQISSTQYSVNAQGRTESWYRSLPHYVMVHLVYHWNKNPKNRK